jgi:hypothetical protein
VAACGEISFTQHWPLGCILHIPPVFRQFFSFLNILVVNIFIVAAFNFYGSKGQSSCVQA